MCRLDTVHTVLEVEGLQVRLARCVKCGTEAPLKVARHKTRAGLRAVMQKKADESGAKKKRTRKVEADPALPFRQSMVGKDISAARDYSAKLKLQEGDVIRHRRFGIGVVTAIQESSKAVIQFEDGPRTLVFGRG